MGDKGGTPVYERPRIEEIGTLHDLTKACVNQKCFETADVGTGLGPPPIQLS